MEQIVERLEKLMEDEARSCSMDFGCMTPLYAYRMFGGQYSMEDIENGLMEIRKQGFMGGYEVFESFMAILLFLVCSTMGKQI